MSYKRIEDDFSIITKLGDLSIDNYTKMKVNFLGIDFSQLHYIPPPPKPQFYLPE
jgi:hypothetical protein